MNLKPIVHPQNTKIHRCNPPATASAMQVQYEPGKLHQIAGDCTGLHQFFPLFSRLRLSATAAATGVR
ncbi:MAG: hypothetical protein ACXWIU_07445, partial [Limisphaerales bacterium]